MTSRRVGPILVCLGLVAAGGLVARRAEASSITLTLGHNLDGGCLSGNTSGATGPLTLTGSCTDSVSSATGLSVGDYGSLGVQITNSFNTGFSFRSSASASAQFLGDGYVISGPAGSVTTAFTIDLSGLMQQTCAAFVCSNVVSLQASAPGMFTSGSTNLTNGTFFNTGQWDMSALFGAASTIQLTTLPFTVATNTPFTLSIRLAISDDYLGGGSGSTADDLAHTLTFHMGGDVFSLPAGYTINGPGIVNNRYGAQTPAPVPEPASLVLLGAGLGIIAARLRGRRHRAVKEVGPGRHGGVGVVGAAGVRGTQPDGQPVAAE